ncbi:MAG: site-specific DNA-methyltransferase [Gammaproteobacteria bacterium]|nr:site-specific DNA-methyltransferase [Gammaproteobacteria bacterium]MYF53942.1 site-specific DNA-methyltransferase [Gammaproteobacteria bacterium]MYK44504.1 site-specific DNA-methyltransferase [Gammaproteobacteria bacterium]
MSKSAMQSFGTTHRVGHDSSNFYQRKMFATDNFAIDKQLDVETECPSEFVNRVFQQSSADMHQLPDNCVHLIVTSPPYNVGKDYDDDLSMDQYRDLLNSVWGEVYRVLVPGGRACINIANLGRKPYLPLNAMISQQMLEIGFLMRGEIIWDKSASAGTSCAWGSWKSASNPVLRDTHEYILVYSKGRYNRESKGKTSTISKEEFLNFTKSVWQFPAESAKRVNHPAPFPIELPRRLIELYTYIDDLVLDPFIGSGTTAIAAKLTERQYIGYEVSPEYLSTAQARIETQFAHSPAVQTNENVRQ